MIIIIISGFRPPLVDDNVAWGDRCGASLRTFTAIALPFLVVCVLLLAAVYVWCLYPTHAHQVAPLATLKLEQQTPILFNQPRTTLTTPLEVLL